MNLYAARAGFGDSTEAVASLDVELTEAEVQALEASYTPRPDFQGISDDAELQRIMARLPQITTRDD